MPLVARRVADTSVRALAITLMALVGLVAAGCVEQPQLPADCSQSRVTRNATLTSSSLEPRNIDVCRGQEVVLDVKVETDGVLHIHGYDQQAKEVRVGQAVTFDFPATRSGQFVIELHTPSQSAALGMGVFTVHER